MQCSDEKWMALAWAEALKGRGHTSPNPAVGAVLVKGNRLLAKGYHRRAGLPHAEAVVLNKTKRARGATLYVTLEPCCHLKKKTPPCVPTILEAGIGRVVIGSVDPNPKVRGRGVRQLRRAGIEVQTGLLKERCNWLIREFSHWQKRKTPYVSMKIAASLDGRVALKNGKSRWITGPQARKYAHQLRLECDAILVGIGTVLQDDPQLNVRLGKKSLPQPYRILLDPNLKVPLKAKAVNPRLGGPTWVMTRSSKLTSTKAKKLIKQGVELWPIPFSIKKGFDLKAMLISLGEAQIQSLLVEGGPGVWTTFWKSRLIQELHYFVAPKILGSEAYPALKALSLKSLPPGLLHQALGEKKLGVDHLFNFLIHR